MIDILLSLLLFCLSVFCHILYCRRHSKQQLHTKAHCIIVAALAVVYLFAAFYVKNNFVFAPDSLMGASLEWTGLIILIMLVPIYASFYVWTQLTSPSKKIIETIVLSKGVRYDDIYKSIAAEDLVGTRLRDLKASGCIEEDRGIYRVTSSGKVLANVLHFMQKCLGRDTGG